MKDLHTIEELEINEGYLYPNSTPNQRLSEDRRQKILNNLVKERELRRQMVQEGKSREFELNQLITEGNNSFGEYSEHRPRQMDDHIISQMRDPSDIMNMNPEEENYNERIFPSSSNTGGDNSLYEYSKSDHRGVESQQRSIGQNTKSINIQHTKHNFHPIEVKGQTLDHSKEDSLAISPIKHPAFDLETYEHPRYIIYIYIYIVDL